MSETTNAPKADDTASQQQSQAQGESKTVEQLQQELEEAKREKAGLMDDLVKARQKNRDTNNEQQGEDGQAQITQRELNLAKREFAIENRSEIEKLDPIAKQLIEKDPYQLIETADIERITRLYGDEPERLVQELNRAAKVEIAKRVKDIESKAQEQGAKKDESKDESKESGNNQPKNLRLARMLGLHKEE